MIVKVRKIGNSLGVLLSKALVEQCSIKDEVSLEVKDNAIIIKPIPKTPRKGWENQFVKAGSLNDNDILMGEVNNSFDKDEWTW